MRTVTAVGVGALLVLCALRRHDLAAAMCAVPPHALGALAALHLTSLVARSEAWRLSLAALAGTPPSRAAIHSANAGAFVAGALEAHAAMPARVALLRRLAPHQLPHPTHLAVADVPILLLEAAGAAALLGVTGAWWAPPGALAALLAARLGAGACGRPRRELHGITTGFRERSHAVREPRPRTEPRTPRPPLTRFPRCCFLAPRSAARRRAVNPRSAPTAAPARAARRPGTG